MQRLILCLITLLLAFPLTGCTFLRRVITSCLPYFSLHSGRIDLEISCPWQGRASQELSTLRDTDRLAGLQKAVHRGLTPGFDECRDFCDDPDSVECDDCRMAVGRSMFQPYISICQGTAYQTLPDTLPVQLEVATDRGVFTSPVFIVRKDRGTTRWDDCGGENVDYVLPEAAVRAWERSAYQQGARAVNRISVIPVGRGAGALFNLKDEYGSGQAGTDNGPPDLAKFGIGIGFWLFRGAGVVSSMILPGSQMPIEARFVTMP